LFKGQRQYVILTLQQGTAVKRTLFLFFLVISGCLVVPQDQDDVCYEIKGKYPIDCWVNRYYEECCEWKASRHCVEVWCSDLDRHGYNECRWNFEESYCF